MQLANYLLLKVYKILSQASQKNIWYISCTANWEVFSRLVLQRKNDKSKCKKHQFLEYFLVWRIIDFCRKFSKTLSIQSSVEECSDNLRTHYITQKMRQDLFFPTHLVLYYLDHCQSLYAPICGHLLSKKKPQNTRVCEFFQKNSKCLSFWWSVEKWRTNLYNYLSN